MAFEPRDNSGALFVNDRREKDTHPNAKGSATIDGVEYWVSAWTKTDRNGKKFQSLSFEPKDKQQASRGGYAPPADDLSDEIPF